MLELNKLYNMDCLEAMKEFPDKYFELAIVDPPYGININNNIGRRQGDKKSDYKKVTWDSEPPNEEYFKELFRISENQIIWGANHFVEKINKNSSCWIVWDKLFSEDVSFASCEYAWTSFAQSAKTYYQRPQNADVQRIHPTQKPVKLYQWLLSKYAKQGDRILDTHLGSGSSAIAAHYSGFDFVGVELDEDYYQAAQKRFQDETAQGGLF